VTQGDYKSFKITERAFIATDIIKYSNANKNCSNVKLFSNTFIHANIVDDKISNVHLQMTVTNQNNMKWVLCHYIHYNILYTVSDLFRHITKTLCLNTPKTVVVPRATTTCDKILQCSVSVGIIYFGNLKLIVSYINRKLRFFPMVLVTCER